MNKIILFLFIARVYAQQSVGSDAETGYAGKKVELTVDLGKVTDPAGDLSVSLKPVVNYLKSVKLDTLLTESIKDVKELTGKIKNKEKDKQLEEVIKSLNAEKRTDKTKKEADTKFKQYFDDILLTYSAVEKKLNELKAGVLTKTNPSKGKASSESKLSAESIEALSVNANQQLFSVLQDALNSICKNRISCFTSKSIREGIVQVNKFELDLVKSLNKLLTQLSQDTPAPQPLSQKTKLNVFTIAKLQTNTITDALTKFLQFKFIIRNYMGQNLSVKPELEMTVKILTECIKRGADDKDKTLQGYIDKLNKLGANQLKFPQPNLKPKPKP